MGMGASSGGARAEGVDVAYALEDYWILNLVDRVLEVYRDSAVDPVARYGWRYRSVTRLVPPAVVAPLAFPSGQIAVADLLPPRP